MEPDEAKGIRGIIDVFDLFKSVQGMVFVV
jgi:hypothetical protein